MPKKTAAVSDGKLTIAEALAKKNVERHNAAVGNVVSVLTGIADKRAALKKALDECDADEKLVNDLAKKIDTDPVDVNDDPVLFVLHDYYTRYRGVNYCRPEGWRGPSMRYR